MAVRGLGTWLRETYPSALLRAAPKAAAVHVDANSAVHAAARGVRAGPAGDRVVLSRAAGAMAGLAARHVAEAAVFAHMDGAAHAAKVGAQRERRAAAGAEAARRGTWPTQQVTPGCAFALRAERALARAGVAVSGAGSAGEGEAKIFASIRRAGSAGRALIYGSDGDLPLLALGHIESPPIVIATPPWDGGPPAWLDVFALGDALLLGTGLDRRALVDLAAASALAGNDYVPPVPWASFRATWPITLRERISLVDKETRRLAVSGVARLAAALMRANPAAAGQPGLLKPDAVLPYLARVDWSLRQSLGWAESSVSNTDTCTTESVSRQKPWSNFHSIAKTNNFQTDSSPLFDPCAPTLHDLAHMDVDAVAAALPALSDAHAVMPEMLPGTAAVMVLDASPEAATYLPRPLRPIAEAFWAAQNAQPASAQPDMLADIARINAAVACMRHTRMSPDDRLIIFGTCGP